MKLLTKRICCYVPFDSSKNCWHGEMLGTMAGVFGGATMVKADGGYVSKDGYYWEEEMRLIYSWTTSQGLRYGAPKIREAMKYMGKELKQETVALEVGGKLEIWEIENEEVEGVSRKSP